MHIQQTLEPQLLFRNGKKQHDVQAEVHALRKPATVVTGFQLRRLASHRLAKPGSAVRVDPCHGMPRPWQEGKGAEAEPLFVLQRSVST